MIQRLRLLMVTLFALYSGSAFALSLGEIELKSALNQRLDAEIILSNISDLELGEITSKLASKQDFDRVGVDRDDRLTDLRFNTRVLDDGVHIVHITSINPIVEPFLNFIVETIWPTGRIMSEYIVLLDPPVFSNGGIEKIESGMFGGSTSSSQPVSRLNDRRETPAAPSVLKEKTEGGDTQHNDLGLTGEGDTLWAIASKVRPSGRISVQQTMLALQRANPEAFINNNINLLKAGYLLRVPGESEILGETSAQAVLEVRVQSREFEDYRSSDVTKLDARRTASRSSGGSDDADDGELKLLSADQFVGSSSRNDPRVGELENSLAVLREDLDRSERANSELNVRLVEYAGQLETINELVKLKDDQLAGLRAELERQADGMISKPTIPLFVQQIGGSLLSSPQALVGVGVLFIGLVAGVLMIVRKRRQDFQQDHNEFTEVMIDEGRPELSWSDDADEGFEENSKNLDGDLDVDDDDLSFDLDDLDEEIDEGDRELTADIGEELILDEALEVGDLDIDLDLDREIGGLELDLVDDDALDLDLDDDSLELGDDEDELNLDQDASSKLDLARAYIEMGDNDGAKPLLEEVLREGDDEQVSEANELISNIR